MSPFARRSQRWWQIVKNMSFGLICDVISDLQIKFWYIYWKIVSVAIKYGTIKYRFRKSSIAWQIAEGATPTSTVGRVRKYPAGRGLSLSTEQVHRHLGRSRTNRPGQNTVPGVLPGNAKTKIMPKGRTNSPAGTQWGELGSQINQGNRATATPVRGKMNELIPI